tara:strand:- start:2184 stop:3800 length:1617 start_codon:yes stop_codon:yes gene_type:complete
MKGILLIILVGLGSISGVAQKFGLAGDCEVNVYDPNYVNYGREGIISATVKLTIEGACSGTLINRNTADNNLGYYVLTARHCIENIDFEKMHTVHFNYQSPDGFNASTASRNRGGIKEQSDDVVGDGYEYNHKTKLRLVADYLWGDMALIEILTPVPVHFNVTFAGWNPSRFYMGTSVGFGTDAQNFPSKYAAIHHPRGDIKKISGVNHILWLESPIATGCYTVTTVVDVLFGWIWGNSTSTSVICNYVDNPWLNVPLFNYGILEPGSSGSGLFNINNDNIGVLSGGLSNCELPVLEFYGKLHANYSKNKIKNTLNPSNELWVDIIGLDERKITCYDNLILPGATGVSGEYFPANHYQSENKIIINSKDKIVTDQGIRIYSGANYEFIARNQVILGLGFDVESGAEFVAKTGSCNENKLGLTSSEQKMISKLHQIELPESINFKLDNFFEKKTDLISNVLQVYPNPNRGSFNVLMKFLDNSTERFTMEIVDYQGRSVFNGYLFGNLPKNIDARGLISGLYIVKVNSKDSVYSVKIIVE